MENYFEHALSEEQMAAYLDGMLSEEENSMVEEIIASDPEMEEIMDTIDSVDTVMIYEADDEIPIECIADNFTLPDLDAGDTTTHHYYGHDEIYEHDEAYDYYEGNGNYEEDYEPAHEGYDDSSSDYQDEANDLDYHDNSSVEGSDNLFLENDLDGLLY